MRVLIAAVAAAVALVVTGMLGVASAEAPTSTPTRTVSVQGVGTQPVAQNASAAAATAVYRQAMAAAVADGQSKAEFLAGKVGTTLGAAQSVSEDGGWISCSGGESEYPSYEGEQPDFGSARGPVSPLAAAPAAPAARTNTAVGSKPKPMSKKRRKRAKAAVVATCVLHAEVSLSYVIG